MNSKDFDWSKYLKECLESTNLDNNFSTANIIGINKEGVNLLVGLRVLR